MRRLGAAQYLRIEALERDTHIACKNQKRAMPIITFTDNQIATLIANDSCIVEQNLWKWHRRGKCFRIDITKWPHLKQPVDVLLGHRIAKRHIPPLRAGDREF